MKISQVTNHAVKRFKERIEKLGINRTEKEIRKIIKDSIINCPSYIDIGSYFIDKFKESKKIPIPILDINSNSIGEFKVVLKKDRNKPDNYAVVTVY